VLLDPLGLVRTNAGTPSVDVDAKALVSIRDYLERNGAVEGKRLTDHFSSAPFGWSSDTVRYLVACLLLGGQIKLKVAGREITVSGQQAVEALRTNNAFKTVGVSLRDGDRPSMEVLARAAERMTELVGETVLPFPEDEISKAAIRHFPQLQFRFGPLAERLSALRVAGADQVREVNQQIVELLQSDASDAPKQVGAEESSLYDGLKWAREVDLAFKAGLDRTIQELQRHRRAIEALRRNGVPGDLRNELEERTKRLKS